MLRDIMNLDSFFILINVKGEIRIVKSNSHLSILFRLNHAILFLNEHIINFIIADTKKLSTFSCFLLGKWL